MYLIRAYFRTDDLPVVLAEILDLWNDKDGNVWDNSELVQYAREKYAETNKYSSTF